MIVKHDSSCSWWPWLVSFLLITGMSSILFGGFKGMLEYRKSMEPDLTIDKQNIKFFTKDYLKRLYQRLTVKELEDDSQLTSFYLYTDEKNIDSLESDLPASGKTQYRQGHIKISEPEFSSDMQFRYRGGLPLHWLYKKKSFRVKLPPFTTYRGERQFNLVNPSTIYTLTDWISYEMSQSVGLLTPEYFPARVFINNETNGLHFFLSRIDESFLRKNKRMPGSIYSGDTIYVANPFGADSDGMNELTFPDKKSGYSLMWKDSRLWEKNASRNAESENDIRDLKMYLDIINDDDAGRFMQGYETYFDKRKFYLFWGMDTLVGGFHHDLYHNHKMYFDPYKGKFEPIQWDLRFWTTTMTLPEYPLLRQVKLNPVLDYERSLVIYELWKRFTVKKIVSRIDRMSQQIFADIVADPYRQHPDSNNKQFAFDKVVPFTVQEFLDSIEDLKLTYKKRHEVVKQLLDSSSVKYAIDSAGNNSINLTIEIDGNSPVDFNLWSIIPEGLKPRVSIERWFNGGVISEVGIDTMDRLYPGHSIKKGNQLGNADVWATMTFGKEHLQPSPLHYIYRINGVLPSQLNDINSLSATNAVTGVSHSLEMVTELSNTDETESIHPWQIIPQKQNVSIETVLSGVITIDEDRIFTKEQQVTILPGTVFKLAKNKSIVFYGKVNAIGTVTKPILFKQKIHGEAWGSIVIQGADAAGSQLKYIKVAGGSITTQKLINYPGQLNIHDVGLFKLEHCIIRDNTIGDDALHISYSHGEINHCQFYNTAFDALDMDIVNVNVSNSSFFNVGNDALDLMTSTVKVDNIFINGAGDKCFSVGESSDVNIYNSQLNSCQTGVAVKDESTAFVENLTFNDIKDASIALYRKNPRYGLGGTINGKQLFGLSQDDILVGEGSSNDISLDQLIKTIPVEMTVKKYEKRSL